MRRSGPTHLIPSSRLPPDLYVPLLPLPAELRDRGCKGIVLVEGEGKKSSFLVLCTSQDLSRLCFIAHG